MLKPLREATMHSVLSLSAYYYCLCAFVRMMEWHKSTIPEDWTTQDTDYVNNAIALSNKLVVYTTLPPNASPTVELVFTTDELTAIENGMAELTSILDE